MLLCCTPDPNAYYGVFKKLKTSFAGGPLLGKDFECVQRIFALAGEWQAGIHVLTRIASRGGGAAVAAAKQLLVMEGTAQAKLRGGVP